MRKKEKKKSLLYCFPNLATSWPSLLEDKETSPTSASSPGTKPSPTTSHHAEQGLTPRHLPLLEHQIAGCCFPESRAARSLRWSPHPGDGHPCHCTTIAARVAWTTSQHCARTHLICSWELGRGTALPLTLANRWQVPAEPHPQMVWEPPARLPAPH